MKPGHTAGLVHTDNQANIQAKACIILKARGEKKIMLFQLLIPYISLYAPKEGFQLEAFCVCVLHSSVCVSCMCSCLHVCV